MRPPGSVLVDVLDCMWVIIKQKLEGCSPPRRPWETKPSHPGIPRAALLSRLGLFHNARHTTRIQSRFCMISVVLFLFPRGPTMPVVRCSRHRDTVSQACSFPLCSVPFPLLILLTTFLLCNWRWKFQVRLNGLAMTRVPRRSAVGWLGFFSTPQRTGPFGVQLTSSGA